MLTLEKTEDLGYISSVLNTPGMGRLCNAGKKADGSTIEERIREDSHTFLMVKDSEKPVGFVSFTRIPDTESAYIHVALYTRGAETLNAIVKAMDYAKEQMKLKDVQAIFPEWRSAVNDLAEKTGFYEEGRFRIDGYGDQFFTHQRSIL